NPAGTSGGSPRATAPVSPGSGRCSNSTARTTSMRALAPESRSEGARLMRTILAVLVAAVAGFAHAAESARANELVGIYRELVETDTMQPQGDTTAAARAMAKHLLDAGFDAADVQVIEPYPRRGNL